MLVNWTAQGNLVLLHNPKDAPSFSGHLHTGTNPDLAFASAGHKNWSLDRRILEKFPSSQYRPSLIAAAKLETTVPSEQRWNFRKANWELYI